MHFWAMIRENLACDSSGPNDALEEKTLVETQSCAQVITIEPHMQRADAASMPHQLRGHATY